MVHKVLQFLSTQSGTTAIEYAIVGGIISVAIIAGATLIGIQLSGMFNTAADAF